MAGSGSLVSLGDGATFSPLAAISGKEINYHANLRRERKAALKVFKQMINRFKQ
jgi:hypothetical protein